MTGPRLHLDADTSMRALQRALTERGHDVTHTPCGSSLLLSRFDQVIDIDQVLRTTSSAFDCNEIFS